VLYHNKRSWNACSEGILVWNFTGYDEKFAEPTIFLKEKKALFIKKVELAQNILQER
jgi:hypothetical protein